MIYFSTNTCVFCRREGRNCISNWTGSVRTPELSSLSLRCRLHGKNWTSNNSSLIDSVIYLFSYLRLWLQMQTYHVCCCEKRQEFVLFSLFYCWKMSVLLTDSSLERNVNLASLEGTYIARLCQRAVVLNDPAVTLRVIFIYRRYIGRVGVRQKFPPSYDWLEIWSNLKCCKSVINTKSNKNTDETWGAFLALWCRALWCVAPHML